MGELGKIIRKQVRAAVKDARVSGSTHVASAVNVGGEGHSMSVYSDDDVTVVTTDGQTEVIRQGDDGGHGEPSPARRTRGEESLSGGTRASAQAATHPADGDDRD